MVFEVKFDVLMIAEVVDGVMDKKVDEKTDGEVEVMMEVAMEVLDGEVMDKDVNSKVVGAAAAFYNLLCKL